MDYDLFVIGAGSGGVRAARLAAQSGARVAIAEEYRVGGTCVVRGCIPKKLLVYASEYGRAFQDAKGFGWTVDWARFDWPVLRDNVEAEVTRLSGIYRQNLEKAGVHIIEDRAELEGRDTVRLKGDLRALKAERILIAAGGRPRMPAFKGAEHCISSNEAFLLERLPDRIVILGGGYVAIEFATIFSGLGVETTLVYRGNRILRGFDDELRDFVDAELRRTGVHIIAPGDVKELARTANGYLVSLADGAQIETGLVMSAIGRDPNTSDLGLEAAGVAISETKAIMVDAYSRTSAPNISAIGDITGRLGLTPVAIREAVAYFETEFLKRPTAFDHSDVPTAVFGRPPIAAVGLTEAAARQKYGEADVYKTNFRPMKHILAGNEERAFMKLVVHPRDGRVLGVHLAGRDAPEIVQMAAVAVKAGLTKAQWDATCALHPTAAEELVLLRQKT
ncbi:MAG: glutathione-disulfide reductase [Hyphomonadaceae bacterium]|nr:glutathione-disulfide reductase [Hyphomonadaceae bacterium]